MRFDANRLIDQCLIDKGCARQMLGSSEKKDDWQFYCWLFWVAILFFMLYSNWAQIQAFLLIDTDDNLRMQQVRDLVGGQGWYDLRQYRLDPPQGADIHWSRLVDIPLALIILVMTPIFGAAAAETAATAIAPMLPFAVVFLCLGGIARRTVSPWAWILAAAFAATASSLGGAFRPMRIDHHGWQLAFVALMMLGLTDSNQRRGGLIVGAATALSLCIGLEMLPFLALGGAVVALRWIVDGAQVDRLRAYGVALSAGTALGFLIFASNDNWAARCDSISTVWLSVMLVAGVLLFGLSMLRLAHPLARLIVAAVAAAALGALFAGAYPQCISRPEGISDDAYELWFRNVTEVHALYQQGLNDFVTGMALPLAGAVGALAMLAMNRKGQHVWTWGVITIMSLVSLVMLFWQSRTQPVAELMAIPGASALAWFAMAKFRASASVLMRTLGVVAVFFLFSGLGAHMLVDYFPPAAATPREIQIGQAFNNCMATSNIAPIGKLPKTTMFTFVDLSPRLIATTHHSAITGPYHRNDDAIVDVHKAFGGTNEAAYATIKRHGATHVLICPMMAESTLHMNRSGVLKPKGFYANLTDGTAPAWLAPVELPKGSPFKLWRITK